VAALALLTLGVARHPVGLAAAATPLGLGTGLLTPAIFALVFARTPATLRGSAAATASIFIDLGLTGAPVLVGLLAARASLPAAFLTNALLPLTGALVLTTAGNRRGHGQGQPLKPGIHLTPRRPGHLGIEGMAQPITHAGGGRGDGMDPRIRRMRRPTAGVRRCSRWATL
jgi:MFS family permease